MGTRRNLEECRLRGEIIATCLDMQDSGINQGTAGNVSVRWRDGLLITPSGLPYDQMTEEDIVWLNGAGEATDGQAPSSEWRFHHAIMTTRPEVGAIVHTHSVHATALAMCRRGIPAAHYMVAVAGGPDIRCADYATFGTEALSRNALAALNGRKACLLANHGVIATGPTLERALALAIEIETLAHQYILSLTLGGPTLLSAEEMARVQDKFRNYGRRDHITPQDQEF